MTTQRSVREPHVDDVLGPLSAQIMRLVWQQGEATVASITASLGAERNRSPAYTTVMTVMGRLAGRGLLTRTRRGKRYIYSATEGEDVLIERLGRDAVDAVIDRYGAAAYRQFAMRLVAMDPELRSQLEVLASESETDDR